MKWLLFSALLLSKNVIAQKNKIIDKPIECLYCSGGDTTKINGIICCTDVIHKITIRQVQEALNNQGYSLKVNGTVDKKTKKAIFSFKEKMGLPIDSTLEFYQVLGIIKPL